MKSAKIDGSFLSSKKENNSTLYLWSLIPLILFLLITVSGYAQTGSTLKNKQQVFEINGTVTDESGNQPIPGATVIVKGTTVGTITNQDGNYQLKVPVEAETLIFSFTGMISREVDINNQTTINAILKENVISVNEVVAIGYGTVKKSDLTGSVSIVSTKDLTRNPSPSAAQSLQGKAPGVLVIQNGAPGGGATIRVRGVGSINKGSNPIYIVDGVQAADINGIQPQEIENIQVLKDASATAIYGANGSNGVIIVTTKRGKSGKLQVSFNTYLQFNREPEQYDIMDADQYSAFYKDIYGDKPEYDQPFREKYYGQGWEKGTNWQNEMFKTGFNQNYHLSVAGGGENSNYSVSFGYVKEDGTVIKTNAERYTIRANSDFELGEHIKFGESLGMNYRLGESPLTNQIGIYDLNPSPLMKVYNSNYKGGFESCQTIYWEDADRNLQQGALPNGYNGPVYNNTLGNDKPNPLAAPSLSQNNYYNLKSRASLYLQINFTKWLMYKITPSAEVGFGRTRAWMPLFEGNRAPGSASLSEQYNESIDLNLENQLLFNKEINGVHNIQATLVHQVRASSGHNIAGSEKGFDFEQLNTLANGGTSSKSLTGYASDYRMLSYLGRVIYDYKGKYFATVSFRSDGVSVFAPNYRRGNFASSSLAYKINEDFFKNVKKIDALKLRVGWGQTGNSDIGAGFQYLDNITEASYFSPVFGDDQHVARAQYVLYGFGSKEIHWESAEMINIGVDINMFNNKLQSSVEYYIKNNKDLLVAVPISAAFGRANGNPWYNTGNIQNRGVELSLQWRDNVGAFSYGIVSNLSTVTNEVKYLPISDITNNNNRTIVGHSIGALYGFVSEGILQLDESNYELGSDGNWQINSSGLYTGYKHASHAGSTPQPGDLKYSDLNGDGMVNDLDKTIIGKTIPGFNYSIGFDCSYKNFDFNVFLYGVGDFDIYNQQRALLSTMNSQDMDHNKLNSFAQDHWTVENESTTYVRVDPSDKNVNERISTFWIENGSFLRIKDLQLGYTVAKNTCLRLGVESIRIYANASNLYCVTTYQGRDPEGFISSNPLNGGTDNGAYSTPRSFACGVQIGF
jgi:TonB-linked SusC/RagA family outer membrane protein